MLLNILFNNYKHYTISSLFAPSLLVLLSRVIGAIFAGSLIFEKCLVHIRIVLLNHLQNLFLARLHQVPADDHFLKDKVSLVEVKDQI